MEILTQPILKKINFYFFRKNLSMTGFRMSKAIFSIYQHLSQEELIK
jgi:hypothetical protein